MATTTTTADKIDENRAAGQVVAVQIATLNGTLKRTRNEELREDALAKLTEARYTLESSYVSNGKESMRAYNEQLRYAMQSVGARLLTPEVDAAIRKAHAESVGVEVDIAAVAHEHKLATTQKRIDALQAESRAYLEAQLAKEAEEAAAAPEADDDDDDEAEEDETMEEGAKA
jgi:hypothetical protein